RVGNHLLGVLRRDRPRERSEQQGRKHPSPRHKTSDLKTRTRASTPLRRQSSPLRSTKATISKERAGRSRDNRGAGPTTGPAACPQQLLLEVGAARAGVAGRGHFVATNLVQARESRTGFGARQQARSGPQEHLLRRGVHAKQDADEAVAHLVPV